MENLVLPTPEMIEDLRVHPFWEVWKSNKPDGGVMRKAGVALTGKLRARSVHVQDVALTWERAQNSPGEPPSNFQVGSSSYLVASSISDEQACTMCVDGEQSCFLCGGAGKKMVAQTYNGETRQVAVRCSSCSGTGTGRCSTCEGRQLVVHAQQAVVTDEEEDVRYTYLPDLPFHLEEALYEVFDGISNWPAAQNVPMTQAIVGDPYRGSRAVAAPTEFHGFDYSEALAEAKSMVKGRLAGRKNFESTFQTHVVPMLIALHGGEPFAHFIVSGQLVTVGASTTLNLPKT